MRRTGNQNEIIRGIVKFIPVRMMDNLGMEQRPSQFQGHDMPMLKDQFTVNRDGSISLSGNAALPISPFLADIGIAITNKPQIMAITKTMPLDRGISADSAAIGVSVFHKFASLVFNHSVHVSSFSSNIQRIEMEVKRNGGANGVNSGKPKSAQGYGNPEPSREYTPGRCRDYRRGKAPLITGKSAPLVRDDIVRTLWKLRDISYNTDCDGVGMEKPAAAGATGLGRAAVAGVVAESIAASAYGLVQVYGYHSAVRCISATTGSGAIAKGTALVGAKTAWYALENAGKTGTQANAYCKGFALAANASYTTKAIAAFVLCL